jgi:hypothetical protein
MSLVADMRSPRLWQLWNSEYRYGSDAADEGFVVRTEHGWALHRRGIRPQAQSVYDSLDEAFSAAGVERRTREARRADL